MSFCFLKDYFEYTANVKVVFFREDKLKMEVMLSGLERMVEYDLIVLLKYLSKKDKMSLRASSTTLRRRIDELENTFKVWRICGKVDSSRLRRLSDEICSIQGNTFNKECAMHISIYFLEFFIQIT